MLKELTLEEELVEGQGRNLVFLFKDRDSENLESVGFDLITYNSNLRKGTAREVNGAKKLYHFDLNDVDAVEVRILGERKILNTSACIAKDGTVVICALRDDQSIWIHSSLNRRWVPIADVPGTQDDRIFED
jgi:hypothetical protein